MPLLKLAREAFRKATILQDNLKNQEALAEYKKAMSHWFSLYRKRRTPHDEMFICMQSMAEFLISSKQYFDARWLLEETFDLQSSYLSETDPSLIKTSLLRAQIMIEDKKYDDALDEYERAYFVAKNNQRLASDKIMDKIVQLMELQNQAFIFDWAKRDCYQSALHQKTALENFIHSLKFLNDASNIPLRLKYLLAQLFYKLETFKIYVLGRCVEPDTLIAICDHLKGPELAWAYNQIALLYVKKIEFYKEYPLEKCLEKYTDKAIHFLELALKEAGHDLAAQAFAWFNLGKLRFDTNQNDGLQLCKQAVAAYAKCGRDYQEPYENAKIELVALLARAGQPEEAQKILAHLQRDVHWRHDPQKSDVDKECEGFKKLYPQVGFPCFSLFGEKFVVPDKEEPPKLDVRPR